MSISGENFLSGMQATIKAIDKINQLTGGRDGISKTSSKRVIATPPPTYATNADFFESPKGHNLDIAA